MEMKGKVPVCRRLPFYPEQTTNNYRCVLWTRDARKHDFQSNALAVLESRVNTK